MNVSPSVRGPVREPELAELARSSGPFVTVWLATEPDVDRAPQRSMARWREVRRGLEEAGVDAGVVEAIDALVPDAHTLGRSLFVVGGGTTLRHVEHGPREPAADRWRVGPAPSLRPPLTWRQWSPGHVVVLADHLGADIVAFRREGPDIHAEAGGHDMPIRKAKAGGWSQRRFQERAENTWEENAAEAAGTVGRIVDAFQPRVVVVAGDVRAVQLLQEHVSKRVAELIRLVESEPPSLEAMADDVEKIVTEVVREDVDTLLDTLRTELGQQDRAVRGAADCLEALSQGQVDVLFVPEGLDEGTAEAWCGEDPAHVGIDEGSVRRLGSATAERGNLGDVAVRAALATGSGVLVVPADAGIEEEPAALLRWSTTGGA